MKERSDRKFSGSKWIAVNDSLSGITGDDQIRNPWRDKGGWVRYSEIDAGDGLPVFRKRFGSAEDPAVKCTI